MAMLLFFKSANFFSFNYLLSVFKHFFFLPFKTFKLNEERLRGARIFLFFFSYLALLIKSWPYYKGGKTPFTSKLIFTLLKRTSY